MSLNTPINWSQQDIDQCIASWAKGNSYSLIAADIGTKNRNEVAGFLTRRGYRRSRPLLKLVKRKPTPKLTKLHSVRTAIERDTGESDASRPIVHLLQLEKDGCKFPLGESGNHVFCNQKRVAGVPYCKFHCSIVYRPSSS